MQSTASGKDSVLFGGKFSSAAGTLSGLTEEDVLCGRPPLFIYTLSLWGAIPPGGFPKPADMVYCNILSWKSSIGWGRQPDKQQPEDCCLQEGRQRFFFSGSSR